MLQLFCIRSTDWGRYKMVAISQTTFSSAFSWMKMFEFRLKFHWPLFLRVNIPTLVQVMAWCRPGDKPLSEPMMVSLSTHICVTRPQWVKYKCLETDQMKSVLRELPEWRAAVTHLLITCPVYIMAPDDAEPSTDTILTTKSVTVNHFEYMFVLP